MRVAVVDDEKDMRLSITQWLTLSGYETKVIHLLKTPWHK